MSGSKYSACRGTLGLHEADFARAEGVVARAFSGYAYMRYVAGSDTSCARIAAWFARASVRYGMRYGRVDATPDLDGVAVWLGPGQTNLSAWRLLRSGFMAVPLSVGLQGISRAIISSAHMEHEHARFAPGAHWYLFALAVEPACQRRGLGGQLLRPVLSEADGSGTPCYLETHNADNVRFYQRHGFEVMSAARMRDGDMTIYAMLRRPVNLL